MKRAVSRSRPASFALTLLLGAAALWIAHGAPGAERLDPRVQRQAGGIAMEAGRALRAVAGVVTAHYVQHGAALARR